MPFKHSLLVLAVLNVLEDLCLCQDVRVILEKYLQAFDDVLADRNIQKQTAEPRVVFQAHIYVWLW